MDLLHAALLLAMTLIIRCHGFNLDLATLTIHREANGSMFGYTVAQHVDGPQHWSVSGLIWARMQCFQAVSNSVSTWGLGDRQNNVLVTAESRI